MALPNDMFDLHLRKCIKMGARESFPDLIDHQYNIYINFIIS